MAKFNIWGLNFWCQNNYHINKVRKGKFMLNEEMKEQIRAMHSREEAEAYIALFDNGIICEFSSTATVVKAIAAYLLGQHMDKESKHMENGGFVYRGYSIVPREDRRASGRWIVESTLGDPLYSHDDMFVLFRTIDSAETNIGDKQNE